MPLKFHPIDGRISEGVRAVAPAVKRRSSGLLRHVTSAAANTAVATGNTGAGMAAGAGARAGTAGAGDTRRSRLLNVAMRSKTAAAAVEGSNFEDEVGFLRRFVLSV